MSVKVLGYDGQWKGYVRKAICLTAGWKVDPAKIELLFTIELYWANTPFSVYIIFYTKHNVYYQSTALVTTQCLLCKD